jgi:glycerate kinase
MIVSIIDSFKFFLSNKKINYILKKKSKLKNILLDLYFSDGGPGFLETDLLKSHNKKKITINYTNSKKIKTYYKYNKKKKTAFIELSKVCGIENLKKNYFMNTSYGLGLVIKDAIENNFKKIYIGLGASGATDAGVGVLNALGVKFYDKNKSEINLSKQPWNNIKSYDKELLEKLRKKYKNVKIILLSDVVLPLYGKRGSSYLFGPQKGVLKKQIAFVDILLKKFYLLFQRNLKKKLNHKVYGSSGGIPLSMNVLFNTKILNCIKYFIAKEKLKDFIKKNKIKYILTGEGRLDKTSLVGKFTVQLSKFAKKNKIKIFGLFGQVSDEKLIRFFDKCYVIGKKSNNLNKKYYLNGKTEKKIIQIGNKIFNQINK